MAEDPDAVLVRACLREDPDAFGALVEKYSRPLFNVAFRITRDREDAADATQTAFIKAYEKLRTFDSSHRFFSWIYRIAINEALDLAKGRVREKRLAELPQPSAADPEAALAEEEKSRMVQEALQELAPDARVVIVLRHLRGMSYADIGEILGLPDKTVKSRLFTARQKLLAVMVERGHLK
jgi:RNA polymerase sigma-70 factor, ECF subfamily